MNQIYSLIYTCLKNLAHMITVDSGNHENIKTSQTEKDNSIISIIWCSYVHVLLMKSSISSSFWNFDIYKY